MAVTKRWIGAMSGIVTSAIFALVVYGVIQQRNAAQRMGAYGDLTAITIAIHDYDGKHNDLPPAYIATQDGKPGLSWRVAILPYIGEDGLDLYQQFILDEPWDSPHNIKLLDEMPAIYRSPNDPKGTIDTPYRVFVGKDALFSAEPRKSGQRGKYNIQSIPDSSSNTILVVECATKVPWTKPDELEYADDKPLPDLGYLQNDRFLVVTADGSKRLIDKKTFNEPNFRNMIRPNDGNRVDLD